MKKLYLAKVVKDVIFECDDGANLKREAEHFIKEQESCYDYPLKINEIINENQIPQEWGDGAFIFGTNEELSAKDWLKKNYIGQRDLLV